MPDAERPQAASALKVPVAVAGAPYDVVVGSGLIAGLPEALAPFLKRQRVFLITEEQVAALHLPAVTQVLEAAGVAVETEILPPGEASKSFEQLERLCRSLILRGLERRDLIIALGGGVIGDLAGFAAAILLRGVDFVQIPTTLLAQVDSSVGGKTAIDIPEGKNLVGAFHQPRLVLADGDLLATLPARELRAGYAEVVKYGLLGDASFFAWLEDHGRDLLAGDPQALRHAVMTSCAAKAGIVARDELEAGERALLNLGHTFAHALEVAQGYDGQLLHGEAVSLGLVLAARLSAALGHCAPEVPLRVEAHLAALGMPTKARDAGPAVKGVSGADLVALMQRDKKVVDGRLTFILLRDIGAAFISREVPPAAVSALLDAWLAACHNS
ncbi:MAG: 3-dehydroquinate synthase [Pseudomonadota bacterium]